MSNSSMSQRPRVICHMMASIDGRIVTEGWPLSKEGYREYEQVHGTYEPDGWICGRVTMEQHFAAGTRSEEDVARQYAGPPREDFVVPGEHESFAIALDPRGKLVWDSGDMDEDHLVTVLRHRVSDEYLAFLRERGVSYLLAGEEEVDLPLALEKIRERLGVRTLMLEGGGGINGSFLRAGLIDELSVLLAPAGERAPCHHREDRDDRGGADAFQHARPVHRPASASLGADRRRRPCRASRRTRIPHGR